MKLSDAERRRAWFAVAASYTARLSGIPADAWRRYEGPVDVRRIVEEATLPEDMLDAQSHARTWAAVRAAFALACSDDLLSDAAP